MRSTFESHIPLHRLQQRWARGSTPACAADHSGWCSANVHAPGIRANSSKCTATLYRHPLPSLAQLTLQLALASLCAASQHTRLGASSPALLETEEHPATSRRANLWVPWKCGDELHKYELCQYAGYKRRLLKQSYLKHKEAHGE